MPRSVKLLSTSSFSPGLRLDVDAFQLRDGETSDCLNVDLDVRGGIAQRRAVTAMNTSSAPFTSAIHSLFTFAKTDGTEQVLAGSGKYTYYSTGTNFTSIGTTWTSSNRQRACAFRDALYIQNGVDAPRKWTGSSVSNLAQTFNDNLASPNDGDMPIAKTICAWQGYVWVANTYESATAYGSRVRFSHPNRAEDWRTDDYIDVNVGEDGDEITALVPLADRLLVFKRHSVHVITGYDPDTFSTNFVAAVGAVSQEAVASTEYGVYFFSWPEGLHFLGERGVSYQFDALYPAIRDGDIPDAYNAEITVGWLNRRVWVNVPWGASTKNARSFVLTPGKQGGWTQYDTPFGPMVEWRRFSSESHGLAAVAGGLDNPRVVRVDQDADTDTWYTYYLNVTGASGSYASTPDSASLSFGGDLDARVLVQCPDYSPASRGTLIGKYQPTGNQRAFQFMVTTSGGLEYKYSVDGVSAVSNLSTVTLASVGIADGTKVWLRVTHDVDNGGGSNEIKFWYSYDGTTWTQLGATVTVGGTVTRFDSTAALTVGAHDTNSERLTGQIYYAELRNGIAGTVVASPDFTSKTTTTTSFADAQANTWTISSPASLQGQSTNIVSSYRTRWYDAGSPAIVKRWKRPDIVFDADVAATLRIGVYHNYDPTQEIKYYSETIVAEGAGALWGAFTFGDGTLYGSGDTGTQTIERGGLLGRARSVALEFAGPTPSKRWSVNSINLKYIPRRVR